MGLLSIPAPVRRQRVHPWPRHPHRPWVRPDDLAGASALLAAIPSLPRSTLARLTERLIDRMDELDGSSDLEATGLEDDFAAYEGDGPGCPIADGRGDVAWTEWTSRGRQKVGQHGAEALARDRCGNALCEDAEDDDPAEDADSDRCSAGDDGVFAGPTFNLTTWRAPTPDDAGHEPGCEDDAEGDEPPAYRLNQTLPLLRLPENG